MWLSLLKMPSHDVFILMGSWFDNSPQLFESVVVVPWAIFSLNVVWGSRWLGAVLTGWLGRGLVISTLHSLAIIWYSCPHSISITSLMLEKKALTTGQRYWSRCDFDQESGYGWSKLGGIRLLDIRWEKIPFKSFPFQCCITIIKFLLSADKGFDLLLFMMESCPLSSVWYNLIHLIMIR